MRRFIIFLLLLWYAPATQLSLRSYVCESNIPLVSYNTYYIVYDMILLYTLQSNSSNESDGNSYKYADVIDDDDCRDRWLYNGNVCCTDAVMQVSLMCIVIVTLC